MNWFTSRVRRLLQWVSKTPKKVAIPVAIVVLGLLFFGGYRFVHFYEYVQEDPNFCRSCHLMEKAWDRWATSAHKNIGCHRCHQQSWLASASLITKFALGRVERIETHAVVPDDSCKKCHESGNPRWIQVADTAGHKKHQEEQNIACTKCHSVTVHRFEAPGPLCRACHTEKYVKVSGMTEMHCSLCHSYLVNGDQLLPSRKACLDCHQALATKGIVWPADAPMQYACGDCHQPHQQAQPLVDCLSCHTAKGVHFKGEHSTSQCQTCHKPHEWRVTQRETCLVCHPGKANHNTSTLCSRCHDFGTATGK